MGTARIDFGQVAGCFGCLPIEPRIALDVVHGDRLTGRHDIAHDAPLHGQSHPDDARPCRAGRRFEHELGGFGIEHCDGARAGPERHLRCFADRLEDVGVVDG